MNIYIHVTRIKEKAGHEFEREQERIYGRVWVKERE